MKQIPLTKIGFFNPGRLTDEEIEQMFISRIAFFQHLFKKVVSETEGSIPQHHLVIGQRGMGKTSLLVRIAAELRKKPYCNSFIALSFPEEQYNVDRLSKFWLNCMDALADALDKEGDNEFLPELDKEIVALAKLKNTDTATIYEAFKLWSKKIKRRPVLLVDNLNLIFEKISKDEQHKLRATLMSSGSPILIGASATTIEDAVDYGKPFYDAFQISYLKKLTFEESLDVLTNLARITGNDIFENEIYTYKGRLEALYKLTGGTPRTLAILFPLIQAGFSEKIQTDLDSILDVITPLYKARFEELAPQLQVVLDAVALHWDPATLDQLRIITQLDNQQLAPQLKRLVDVGWLQKLSAYKAKGGAYELSERFFNIWYLMRRSSRRQKRELYCLTKFLETLYGDQILDVANERANSDCKSENQAAFDLALADAVNDTEISIRLKEKSYNLLVDMSFIDSEIQNRYNLPSEMVTSRIESIWNKANELYNSSKYEEAQNVVKKILVQDAENKDVWVFIGLLQREYLHNNEEEVKAFEKGIKSGYNEVSVYISVGRVFHYKLKNYSEAEKAYKKSIELDTNFPSGWIGLGDLYQYRVDKFVEAEDAYMKAIKLNENIINAWIGLGDLYQFRLNRFAEAEDAYKRVLSINEKLTYPWYSLGNLYKNKLGRFTESEVAYKMAISLNEKLDYHWTSLGSLYAEKLGKYSEAEEAYKKALTQNDKNINAWNGLGNLYQYWLDKYDEAERAYKKALSFNDRQSYTWYNLGNLYKNKLRLYEGAETAYKTAINLDESHAFAWNSLGNLYKNNLNKLIDAESAYKKAIELDEKYLFPLNGLGNLYCDKLGKYVEAEETYKKAILIDPTYAYPWNGLGNLYQYRLLRFEDAETSYKKAIELDEKFANPWNGLGNLYQNMPNKIIEAEMAYRKAISINPKYANPWYGLGNLYKNKLGKFTEAEEAYKMSIKLDEKFDFPWNSLGNLYSENLDKYAEAENAYRKAISLNDKNPYPWNGLGNLYMYRMGKYLEAEDAYKMSIKIDEKYYNPWNGLGNLYNEKLKKFVEAEIAYRKAINLNEKNAYSWNCLGNLYQYRLFKFSEAENAYKKAIEKEEEYATPWNGLGNLYQDVLKKYELAENAYKRAIDLDNNYYSPKYNLVFLWRDKLGKIKDARLLFASIKKENNVLDSYYLNEALFALYDANLGLAEDNLRDAISSSHNELSNDTEDDWFRSASVFLKLGYGDNMLKVLFEKEWNVIMRPFYVAIEAITKSDEMLFLNSISVEVREPALEIIKKIKNHLN